MKFLTIFFFVLTALLGQVLTTLAGGGPASGSSAINSSLTLTQAVAVDEAGRLYFASQSRVFRLEANGSLTRIAGIGPAGFSGDGGKAEDAQLRTPYGLAFDSSGNLYISDFGNHRIRRVSADGIITTIAGNGDRALGGDGGPAIDAQLREPGGLGFDKSGNLYFADSGNHRIRKISAEGIISTVAGFEGSGSSGDDAAAVDARLSYPTDLVFDSSGNYFIADYGNNRIRKVATDGKITAFAGTGGNGFEGDGKAAINALFSGPIALSIDKSNNIFVADYFNHRIRRIASDGKISTIAGTNSAGFSATATAASSAQLYFPRSLALDAGSNLYLADLYNQRIRKISSSGAISNIAGNGAFNFGGEGELAQNAQLNQPAAAIFDLSGNLYIADASNHRVRKVSVDGTIKTVMGDGTPSGSQLSYPSALALDSAGILYIADTRNNRIRTLAPDGSVATLSINQTLRNPSGLATDSSNNLYIADTGNHIVLKRSPSGDITTVVSASAGLNGPYGLAIDNSGSLFIADLYNQRVVKLNAAGLMSEAIPAARNAFPIGLTIDPGGNLVVSYYGLHELWTLSTDGELTKVLDASQLYFPQGLSISPGGQIVIADGGNNRVLILAASQKISAP